MTSVAGVRWGLVFWQQEGRAYAAVTGPETRTGTAPVPEGASFTGIEFAVGTSLRAVSERTVERRFRAAAGLTRGAVRQIERARTAAELLAGGDPAADVVAKLGYFDEPHLARALRSNVGRTAGQLRAGAGGAIALDLDQRLTS